jgi:prepilin-type N-terminal cleavage/methylation domain-containing protein
MWRRSFSLRALDQRGFTMVELLVATTMMVIITGATVSLFISTMKNQVNITKSADQVGEARVALRDFVDDIRQASEIMTTPTSSELKLKTYVHATSCTSTPSATATGLLCEVLYKCAKEASKATYECTRKVSTASAVIVASGLKTNEVFTYTPSAATTATFITAKLVLPAPTGTNTTTLESGSALRNSATNLSY